MVQTATDFILTINKRAFADLEYLPQLDIYWFICAAALLIGCTLQAAIGFGMALISAPIIVMVKPQWVPYIMAVMALTVSLNTVRDQFSDIQWRNMLSPMIARIPGTILGTWLLVVMSLQHLQIAVALMVMLSVFITMRLKPFPATNTNLGIAGFVSGITGTTTSIGGPPIALVMQHSAGATARANLSLFFVYSCIISIAGYHMAGLMTPQTWLVGLSLAPIAFVGFWLGKRVQKFVDNRFRPILLTMCTLSALTALSNAVYTLYNT